MERTYDENDREIYSLYIEYDNEDEAVYTEAAKLSYGEGGQVSSENLIVYGPEGKQLRFIEKWNESDTTSTAEGELLDKDGNKLADYSFERTVTEDGSEVQVDTYIYPNGRVDIISKTVDADENITIRKQLDFKAAGGETGETPDDIDYDELYNWPREKSTNDIDEPDDELIRFFEDISDIWGESFDGDTDDRTDEVNDDLNDDFDDLYEEINNVSDAVPADNGGEPDEIGDNDGDTEDRNEEDDEAENWSGDDGSSESWSEDNGSSSSWSGDSGSSSSSSGDSGGSDDWSGDDGGSEDWDGDDDGFGD